MTTLKFKKFDERSVIGLSTKAIEDKKRETATLSETPITHYTWCCKQKKHFRTEAMTFNSTMDDLT